MYVNNQFLLRRKKAFTTEDGVNTQEITVYLYVKGSQYEVTVILSKLQVQKWMK